MRGVVLRSVNNIYSVRTDDGKVWSCRIKGKKLALDANEYNPVVAGDFVQFDVCGTDEGMVVSREDRKSMFARWNTKAQMNQTICANMDMLVIVCSVDSPPFRPRFIDRVIACAKNVDIVICLNKTDLKLGKEDAERFKLFSQLGYKTVAVSAEKGKNIRNLRKMLAGKTVAFVGQSGVGKSSLINALADSDQRTGEVSWKYNRGCHTTTCAQMIDADGFTVIDTPGFREVSVPHDDPHRLASSFPEFMLADGKCAFDSCLHRDEDGCEVRKLVEAGIINNDRYESYLRILDSLDDRLPVWSRKCSKGHQKTSV